ncbi:mitochondrial basic amino acids transporter isoform X1 [Bacillus rossius redtenbacheri]|uniref:mitochondrial basic amino acids transporter isoform X1 n=1 Tax=Bacillus rossius redtenbacheri TaxID=93214 RepID=UPI002FDC83A3
MALDFLAGCLGGCAGILVGHPFDTVKVHLQTQDFQNPKYRGTLHCFQSIIRRESVAGLYRGMSSPLVAVAAVNAIVFGVYGNAQRHMGDPDSLASHLLAGCAAGLVQSFVCSPVELGKTRAQLQSGASPLRCLREVVRRAGLRGVYRGLAVTVAREVPGYGVYFLAYEAMTRGSERLGTPGMLLAGGLSGMASWFTSYPADVVKSRLQADTQGRYKNAVDCLRKSVAQEGLPVLYRGLASTLLRAFPTNAATFAVVTWVMRCFADVPQECAAYHTPLRGGEFVTMGAPQLDARLPPAWLTLLEVRPRALPEVTPRMLPEVTPRTLPEVTPRTLPEVTPRALPEVTPRTLPEVTSRTLPARWPSAHSGSRLVEEQARMVLLEHVQCVCADARQESTSPSHACCFMCSRARVLPAGEGPAIFDASS